MIFLVSKNKGLFNPEKYKHVDFLDAMKILDPIRLVQLDTETQGSIFRF